jgi:hypothetical protein
MDGMKRYRKELSKIATKLNKFFDNFSARSENQARFTFILGGKLHAQEYYLAARLLSN